ncbi:hypothetical protein A0U92_03515 [Acetobacter aceti]|uniref:Uncharacterized protein n=1 Tax=Acetobacter aceti TaxID=435 RepID=A0A1U9KE33_ACEAC|nr:hypothetical protein [Acetobacter aceti]AQS83989.1 hypothetical protein A0U92_03515 [Acetobacter aceti]
MRQTLIETSITIFINGVLVGVLADHPWSWVTPCAVVSIVCTWVLFLRLLLCIPSDKERQS